MVKCIYCNKYFKRRTEINGVKVDTNRKIACLDCKPFKKRILHTCLKCNNLIPKFGIYEDKIRNLRKRKYCLDCVPFGKSINRQYNNRNPLKGTKSSEKRLELKIKIVEYLNGKCKICGYDKNYTALVPHHRDPQSKKFSFGGKIMPWDKIKEELDKCDLLCANCHAELHNPNHKINKL